MWFLSLLLKLLLNSFSLDAFGVHLCKQLLPPFLQVTPAIQALEMPCPGLSCSFCTHIEDQAVIRNIREPVVKLLLLCQSSVAPKGQFPAVDDNIRFRWHCLEHLAGKTHPERIVWPLAFLDPDSVLPRNSGKEMDTWAEDVTQLVECLPDMYKALGLSPSTT